MNQKEIEEKLFIVSSFMDSTLLNENYPMSVYNFCKNNDIEEKTFYKYFGSFDAVKKMIWKSFYDNAISLLKKDKDFRDSTPKEKLLSFYYTFFEILFLNRSYILFVLSKEQKILNKISDLKILRVNFKAFATELIEEGNIEKPSYLQHPPKIFSEAAWVQLGFLLKFWVEDTSESFEKTDQAIEKSVQTAFDVFENTPLSTLIDFGKFLWKEKFVSY
jgi:AcrR family transcriptional regulator